MRSVQQRNRRYFLKNIPEHLSIFKKVITKLEKMAKRTELFRRISRFKG